MAREDSSKGKGKQRAEDASSSTEISASTSSSSIEASASTSSSSHENNEVKTKIDKLTSGKLTQLREYQNAIEQLVALIENNTIDTLKEQILALQVDITDDQPFKKFQTYMTGAEIEKYLMEFDLAHGGGVIRAIMLLPSIAINGVVAETLALSLYLAYPYPLDGGDSDSIGDTMEITSSSIASRDLMRTPSPDSQVGLSLAGGLYFALVFSTAAILLVNTLCRVLLMIVGDGTSRFPRPLDSWIGLPINILTIAIPIMQESRVQSIERRLIHCKMWIGEHLLGINLRNDEQIASFENVRLSVAKYIELPQFHAQNMNYTQLREEIDDLQKVYDAITQNRAGESYRILRKIERLSQNITTLSERIILLHETLKRNTAIMTDEGYQLRGISHKAEAIDRQYAFADELDSADPAVAKVIKDIQVYQERFQPRHNEVREHLRVCAEMQQQYAQLNGAYDRLKARLELLKTNREPMSRIADERTPLLARRTGSTSELREVVIDTDTARRTGSPIHSRHNRNGASCHALSVNRSRTPSLVSRGSGSD